jgi:hypothetical protein
MKHLKKFALAILLFLFVLMLNSCSAIEGIFKAGVWTGIIIILAVIGLIVFIISRAKK